jgi:SPP1 family predicted phage head-tail adaptor
MSRNGRTAGEFRTPIIVQRPVVSDDGSGGQCTTWENHALLYCSIKSGGDGETFSESVGGRIRTNETNTYTTWWRTDITTKMRLLHGTKIFNIRAASNYKEQNKFLVITGETGVET